MASSGRAAKSPPRPRSKIAAAGTIGTTPPVTGEAAAVLLAPALGAVGGGEAEGASPGEHHGVHGPGQRRGVQGVGLVRPGAAAADIDGAHGPGGGSTTVTPLSQPSPVLPAWPTRSPGTSVIAVMAPLCAPAPGPACHRPPSIWTNRALMSGVQTSVM